MPAGSAIANMELNYIILAVIVATIVLMQLNQRLGSPVLAIAVRWLRWLMFALGAAYLCADFELINRPLWVLMVTFMLVWFLGETLYNWLGIKALSVSPLPLFPRYTLNRSGDEWPTHSPLLKVRDWLRLHDFRQTQALRAEIGGGIYLRVSIYQNAAATIRVQVTFLPRGPGAVAVCYSLISQAADGTRYVTDNFYIPFAGFYPENWLVERRPLTRRLTRLLKRHQRRTARASLVPLSADPLAELNLQQSELDQLNTQMGFLHPQPQREEYGKLTAAGRYRVWKEIWMLNYLGRAVNYR